MFNKKEKQNTVEKKKSDEDWMTKKWRPLMAMMYMTCCLADFFLFPIMFTIVQFWETQAANDAFRQWVPITLQGGGLFHVAMGAVLGVTAYGRTQEKLGGATGGTPLPGATNATPTPAAFSAPAPATTSSFGSGPSTGGFGSASNSTGSGPAAVTNSWGSQPLGSGSSFGSTPSAGFDAPATAEVVTGFGGKPAPVIPPFPEK